MTTVVLVLAAMILLGGATAAAIWLGIGPTEPPGMPADDWPEDRWPSSGYGYPAEGDRL